MLPKHLSLLLFIFPIAFAELLRIVPTKDTTLFYSSYACPPQECGESNYGNLSTLGMGTYHISQSILLEFPLNDLANDAVIRNISLTLFLEEAGPGWSSDSSIQVFSFPHQWQELSITANSAPNEGIEIGYVQLSIDEVQTGYQSGSVSLDSIQDMSTSNNVLSVLLRPTGSVGYSVWCSREGENPPQLLIDYDVNEPTSHESSKGTNIEGIEGTNPESSSALLTNSLFILIASLVMLSNLL